jgi:hypothetical protein
MWGERCSGQFSHAASQDDPAEAGSLVGGQRGRGKRVGCCNYVVRGWRYEEVIPLRPVPSIVVVPVMAVPAVLPPFVLVPLMLTPSVAPPATAAAVVVHNRRFAARHNDRGGSLDDHRWGRVAFDHDGRRRGVDRGRDDTGADEAANDAPDKSSERGVTGVVAVGEGPQWECRESYAGAESDKPSFHLVTSLRSSDDLSNSCLYEFRGCRVTAAR